MEEHLVTDTDDRKAGPASDLLEVLRTRLSVYDGKATTLLGEAEAALSGEEGYLDALIGLLAEADGHIANGASWLIKSALERGGVLSEVQVEALLKHLPRLTDWATQLHICQSVRLLNVPARNAQVLADWVTGLLDHERPFLRAWSLDALGALAGQYREHSQAFNAALERAHQDQAASVKARARNLRAL